MTDYFGEKSHQVEPAELIAFGIPIASRYGVANELIQLMRFAELVTRKEVAHYVRKAYYDSKACMCSVTLDPAVKEGDAIAAVILKAATATIGQFFWFGEVHHLDDIG